MNDQTYVAAVKKALFQCISELGSIKWLYLLNPEKDFTRNRKITFEKFINICLQMEGGALQNELMKHFDFAEGTPTKSAFCQQRAKVSPEALKFLFHCFTELLMEIDAPKTFKGYRLLACDGSDINIPYNPEDTESYHQNADKHGYNQFHLNDFFDILNGIYIVPAKYKAVFCFAQPMLQPQIQYNTAQHTRLRPPSNKAQKNSPYLL